MSFHPNDLLTDDDLVAYEAGILTRFGKVEWESRRAKAIEDWLFPRLVGQGFEPHRFRTRFTATKVFSHTGGTYTDQTSAVSDTTENDLNLATVFATVGTDALYVGSERPFRGVSLRMHENVSSASGTLSVALWTDAWEQVAISDGTVRTSGKTLSGGGAVTWDVPPYWVVRKVNGSDPLYWAKVTVSATPTGAQIGQLGCIRKSALRACVTYRTLELIFREAPISQDGPWLEKANWYGQEANDAWDQVKGQIGGEFDTLVEDDVVDAVEETQTAAEVSGGGWSWGRR